MSALLPATTSVSESRRANVKNAAACRQETSADKSLKNLASAKTYAERCSVPAKSLQLPVDFGDGGAFPEIQGPQYPLVMGRTSGVHVKSGSNAVTAYLGSAPGTVPLLVDAEGKLRHDVLATYGRPPGSSVHATYKDLVPAHEPNVMEANSDDATDSEDEAAAAELEKATRDAIDAIIARKLGALKPKHEAAASAAAATAASSGAQYIKYTPIAIASKTPAKPRIIRVSQMPVDPFDPSSYKFKRLPPPPPPPPAPVMHSPPKKLTREEREEWSVPPCISNWKNAKGYTIPLDKRLAADGRGLQEHTISENFAKFAAALDTAERQAREEVRKRAILHQKAALQEQEAKEESLRLLALRAREERIGIRSSNGGSSNLSGSYHSKKEQ